MGLPGTLCRDRERRLPDRDSFRRVSGGVIDMSRRRNPSRARWRTVGVDDRRQNISLPNLFERMLNRLPEGFFQRVIYADHIEIYQRRPQAVRDIEFADLSQRPCRVIPDVE